MVRSKFSLLKKSYNRKKRISPSGSAGFKKKPWILEPYFAFLNDTLEPGSQFQMCFHCQITQIVFKRKSGKLALMPTKRLQNHLKQVCTKIINTRDKRPEMQELQCLYTDHCKTLSIDPLEEAVLKSIANRNSAPVTTLSAMQQWGL